MNKIKKIARVLRIACLKYKANRLARKTRRQYFVVAFGGKIQIISKQDFKNMRQNGIFPKDFTAEQLKQIALCHTPNRMQLNFAHHQSHMSHMSHMSQKSQLPSPK